MIESAEEFVRLRESNDPRAAHEEAPLEVWHAVIAGWPEMREWVALNKTVPVEILEVLARDEDVKVRTTVAMKRKLTPELFELLAADPDEGVRGRIAYNEKAPAEVIERLKRDPSSVVSDAAKRTSYVYVDGNNNTYSIGRRLEYIPVTKAQSSSGEYSGGEPKSVEISEEQLAALGALVDRIVGDTANVLSERPMGCGTVIRDGLRTFFRSSSPLKAELERMLKQMLSELDR
jgi:hypothetical protein